VVTDRSTFDRRKYPRVRTESLVGGIRFQCVGLEVDLGETLRVQLTIGSRTIQVEGQLVRVTELDGFTQEVALAFTNVDPETLRFLSTSLPEGYELEPNEK
jgi:PilZ domain